MWKLIIYSITIFWLSTSQALASGEFIGTVKVEWLRSNDDHVNKCESSGTNSPSRKMRILEDFSYKDFKSKLWTAPKGHVIDGASIPPFLWSIIGSPFVGNYREASVVHDYYCCVKTEPWQEVHKMFYDAILSEGVSENKAKAMLAVVWAKGPRWNEILVRSGGGIQPQSVTKKIVQRTPTASEEDLQEIINWIERENPSLFDIQQRLNVIINDPIPQGENLNPTM